MFLLIKFDLKQKLKNPLTWFFILILFLMSMISIKEVQNAKLNRSFKGHDIYSWGDKSPFDWTKVIPEDEREKYSDAYYSMKVVNKVQEDIIISNKEDDVKEMTRLYSFLNLLWSKEQYISDDSIMNTVFHRKAIKIWDEVSDGIPYEDIDFRPFRTVDKDAHFFLLAKLNHNLYKNDLPPIYSDEINNVTYLYNYFYNIVPMFIIIITILFIHNIINREKNMGSLKLVITQSISRWKYYISKWISGVIHIIFVLFVPAISISSILGISTGFISMKYPTLYLRNTLSNFKPIPNYLDIFKEKLGYYPILENKYFFHFPPLDNTVHYRVHNKVDIIPFYKYILMVIVLTILFVAFAVALTQLISAIINKEIISFALTSSIFILGTLISSPFKYEKHLNLSPFTMENASRIVIGSYNVTVLTSIIVLLLSTILLLIIGCKYFEKKDI